MSFFMNLLDYLCCRKSQCKVEDNYDFVKNTLRILGYVADPPTQKRLIVYCDEAYLFKRPAIQSKTLVLELNFTLVYISYIYIPDADYVFEYQLNEKLSKIYIKERPYLREFLELLSAKYEIIVYTTSFLALAEFITEKVDIYNRISYVMGSDCCERKNGKYLKNLNYIPRPIKNITAVDYKLDSFVNIPMKLLQLRPYFGKTNDIVLSVAMRDLYERDIVEKK